MTVKHKNMIDLSQSSKVLAMCLDSKILYLIAICIKADKAEIALGVNNRP